MEISMTREALLILKMDWEYSFAVRPEVNFLNFFIQQVDVEHLLHAKGVVRY